jgi:AraC-like DNA-binding protein
MAKKKKESVELRYYEIPQGDSVLTCMGQEWDRVYGYGNEEKRLHFHNLMEIGICHRGEGTLWLDTEKREYKKDTFTIIPANFPHATISKDGRKNFWEYIFFNPKEIVEEIYPGNILQQNEVLQKLSQRAWLFGREDSPVFGQMVDVILRESGNQKPYYRQMIRNYLKNLVLEMMRNNPLLVEERKTGDRNIRIIAALELINENYASPIKVKELADACSMSESHFRRIFIENMNMSPTDYLNFVRIQMACEMMKKSDEPIEHVAVKCGFTTQSTFNRNFRKYLDTSPYQWKTHPSNYASKLLKYNISAHRGW